MPTAKKRLRVCFVSREKLKSQIVEYEYLISSSAIYRQTDLTTSITKGYEIFLVRVKPRSFTKIISYLRVRSKPLDSELLTPFNLILSWSEKLDVISGMTS